MKVEAVDLSRIEGVLEPVYLIFYGLWQGGEAGQPGL